jgi:hypothetical protein
MKKMKVSIAIGNSSFSSFEDICNVGRGPSRDLLAEMAEHILRWFSIENLREHIFKYRFTSPQIIPDLKLARL